MDKTGLVSTGMSYNSNNIYYNHFKIVPSFLRNMNQEKIAFVIHGFPMGGAEKFLINLVNHFYHLEYKPLVVLLSEEKTLLNELDTRIKVVFILKKSRFDFFVSRRIKSTIKKEKIKDAE